MAGTDRRGGIEGGEERRLRRVAERQRKGGEGGERRKEPVALFMAGDIID